MCVSPRSRDCVAAFSPGETVRWSEREKATSNRERARGCPPRDVTRFTTPRGSSTGARVDGRLEPREDERRRESAGPGFWEIFSSRSRCNRTKGAPALRTSCVDGGRERDSSECHRVRRVGNAMVRDRRTRARRASGRRALVVDGGVPCTGRRDERATSGRLAPRVLGRTRRPHRDSLPHGDQPSPGGPGDRSGRAVRSARAAREAPHRHRKAREKTAGTPKTEHLSSHPFHCIMS